MTATAACQPGAGEGRRCGRYNHDSKTMDARSTLASFFVPFDALRILFARL